MVREAFCSCSAMIAKDPESSAAHDESGGGTDGRAAQPLPLPIARWTRPVTLVSVKVSVEEAGERRACSWFGVRTGRFIAG